MDTIQKCLHLVPVPYLSAAFSLFKLIWDTIDKVQASKQQLRVLAECVSHLLVTLNADYVPGTSSLPHTTKDTLNSLSDLLEEILQFAQKQASYNFIQQIFTKDKRITEIGEYHRRIGSKIAAFQISALINVQAWQLRNERALAKDQAKHLARLADLEANHAKFVEALNLSPDNFGPLMVSLQRRLGTKLEEREHRFYSHTLRYLQTTSGQDIKFERWMLTSLDVEFGSLIDTGGFAQVYRGKWNQIDVALKVLKTDGGIAPSSAVILREINTWSKLLHPHILQFLGANVLGDKPFIVMPFLKNGNAQDYIHNNPTCNRQKILYHISLGLLYLHSCETVHGDLKAKNVLIDDSERAVLCDFGLSRLKADVNSRTVKARADSTPVAGSRHWMAPEILMGGLPRESSDVYAFGMVIYEIHTNEIPLGHLSYANFETLLVDRGVRPEEPDKREAPQMTDETWDLATRCWVKDPQNRPTIDACCTTMHRLLKAQHLRPSKPLSAPLSTDAQPMINQRQTTSSKPISASRQNNTFVERIRALLPKPTTPAPLPISTGERPRRHHKHGSSQETRLRGRSPERRHSRSRSRSRQGHRTRSPATVILGSSRSRSRSPGAIVVGPSRSRSRSPPGMIVVPGIPSADYYYGSQPYVPVETHRLSHNRTPSPIILSSTGYYDRPQGPIMVEGPRRSHKNTPSPIILPAGYYDRSQGPTLVEGPRRSHKSTPSPITLPVGYYDRSQVPTLVEAHRRSHRSTPSPVIISSRSYSPPTIISTLPRQGEPSPVIIPSRSYSPPTIISTLPRQGEPSYYHPATKK